ncbi:MAG TPA: amino acid permease, partial [Gemmataceae bacterium]|nr:amino acid permease [Gemmataceae bacterium]
TAEAWRMAMGNGGSPSVKARLGLWDAVSIIVGIVIGSSIYTTPWLIFHNVPGPWSALGLWLLCGALALVGALCYAELATTYPRSGGDYVYLSRAYGPAAGFLFGWAQLAVILPGSIGAMAFIFGDYAAALFGVAPESRVGFATLAGAAAVVALALTNAAGVVFGKRVQNALVATKVLGLGGIILVGLFCARSDALHASPPQGDPPVLGVAMILILYAYGGWNDAALVAADLRRPRDITRALVLGTVGITVIYLAVNAAYILGLGFDEARNYRPTIASDLLRAGLGEAGGKAMNVLVMVSALGAVNGLLFTRTRLGSALGADHRLFAVLDRWHPTLKTPVWSLAFQAAMTLTMIFLVGTAAGRGAIDSALTPLRLGPIPWDTYHGGFDTIFAGTAPVFWAFFLLTGLSVFVLRWRDPTIERPFALPIPLFPLLPLAFCAMCLFGLYSASDYAGWVSLIGLVPLAIGLPLYWLSPRAPGPKPD